MQAKGLESGSQAGQEFLIDVEKRERSVGFECFTIQSLQPYHKREEYVKEIDKGSSDGSLIEWLKQDK